MWNSNCRSYSDDVTGPTNIQRFYKSAAKDFHLNLY